LLFLSVNQHIMFNLLAKEWLPRGNSITMEEKMVVSSLTLCVFLSLTTVAYITLGGMIYGFAENHPS